MGVRDRFKDIRRSDVIAVGCLGAFLLLAYGHAFRLAFINDDYFFLEKVRNSPLWQLWLPRDLIFNWYRPWSRETHYWVLSHLAGTNEALHHLVNFPLALAVLVLYFRLARRLVGEQAAGVSTAGLASLALWSAPVLWVAGAQDLWMLLFALLCLHAVLSDRILVATVAMVMALLSKETAAVLPVIATSVPLILQRRLFRTAITRTAILWLVTIAWLLAHPTLRARVFGSIPPTDEAAQRSAAPVIAMNTLLAQANLERQFAPESGWEAVLLKGLATGLLLCGLVWITSRLRPDEGLARPPGPSRGRVLAFGGAWAAAGFSVLFVPSIGWHAYYGALGSLGFWMMIGPVLARRRAVALAAILGLAITREAHAATPSWDWGTDWYQARAGSILKAIRGRLFELHPSFPAHARIFFAHVPNQIGLLAGNGPAIRIWYGDPTLEAHYYSAYSPHGNRDVPGPDYFFRFDTTRVLVEVRTGPEAPEQQRNAAEWQRDHEVLAALFIRTGDIRGAAGEYAKLSSAVSERSDFALYAGAAHEAIGAMPEAQAFYRRAARNLGEAEVRKRADELIRALPPSAK